MIHSANTSLLSGWFSQPLGLFLGTWVGLFLDLFAFVYILRPKTTPYFVIVLAAFHIVSLGMLNIGLYSILMLSCFVLYFDPSWPAKLLHRDVLATPENRWLALRVVSSFALVLVTLGLSSWLGEQYPRVSPEWIVPWLNLSGLLLFGLLTVAFLVFLGKHTRLAALGAGAALIILLGFMRVG